MECKRCGKIIVGMGHNMAAHLRTACPKAKKAMSHAETFPLPPPPRPNKPILDPRNLDTTVVHLPSCDPVALAHSLRSVNVQSLTAELDRISKRQTAIQEVLAAVESLK